MGESSYADFKILCSVVSDLEGGGMAERGLCSHNARSILKGDNGRKESRQKGQEFHNGKYGYDSTLPSSNERSEASNHTWLLHHRPP